MKNSPEVLGVSSSCAATGERERERERRRRVEGDDDAVDGVPRRVCVGALGCGSKGERVRVFKRGRVSAEKKEGERGHGVGRERDT